MAANAVSFLIAQLHDMMSELTVDDCSRTDPVLKRSVPIAHSVRLTAFSYTHTIRIHTYIRTYIAYKMTKNKLREIMYISSKLVLLEILNRLLQTYKYF